MAAGLKVVGCHSTSTSTREERAGDANVPASAGGPGKIEVGKQRQGIPAARAKRLAYVGDGHAAGLPMKQGRDLRRSPVDGAAGEPAVTAADNVAAVHQRPQRCRVDTCLAGVGG